jgi:hypothetical protein
VGSELSHAFFCSEFRFEVKALFRGVERMVMVLARCVFRRLVSFKLKPTTKHRSKNKHGNITNTHRQAVEQGDTRRRRVQLKVLDNRGV